MIGKPKYNYNDIVSFKIQDTVREGKIYIIDSHGTFEDSTDVSYDILVESENCLYKHIREDLIVQ